MFKLCEHNIIFFKVHLMMGFQSYFIMFFICLISTILIMVLFKSTRANKSRLPPSPFALPIIGHLHLLVPTPHQAFNKLSLQYGPVIRVLMGNVPCVVVSSPETAKEFLKTYESFNLDRPQNAALDYLTYGNKDFAFIPYGSYWKFIKKIVMSQLLNGATLDLLLSVRQDEINLFMVSLANMAREGKAVDVSGELMKTSNNMISRMIMNERCSDKDSETKNVKNLVAEITKIAGKFNISDYLSFCKNLDLQGFGTKLKDIRERYDELIERIVREHEDERKKKTKSHGKDLLHILLDIQEDETMEIELSRENIKALILNMFTAGTDPTAVTIEWALAELINHPNIMKKAINEIDHVIGRKRLLQESDIPSLPYLQAIVKETLRLHPAAPLIPRQSTKDCTVAGYHIPAKTTVFVNIWALGRDPSYWDNPLEFQPERFIETPLDVRGQYFHMLPFGSGRRMCPATSLVMQMVPATLGAMIQCFEWKAGKDGNLHCVDMEEGLSVTLFRANPLICVPVARLDTIPSLM